MPAIATTLIVKTHSSSGVGTNTAVTVSGLQEGQTYYFTVIPTTPTQQETHPRTGAQCLSTIKLMGRCKCLTVADCLSLLDIGDT
jgi:hypothetical protein